MTKVALVVVAAVAALSRSCRRYHMILLILGVVLVSSVAHAATLGIPASGTTLSGIGVISGWKCETNGDLTIRFDGGAPIPLVYGSQRPDVREAGACDHDRVGFVAVMNWNNLGDGSHTAVVYDDSVEFDRSTFSVVTTGETFLRGAAGQCTVPDFPAPNENARFIWNQATQHMELAEVGGAALLPPVEECEEMTCPVCEVCQDCPEVPSLIPFDGAWNIAGMVTDPDCAPNRRWSGSFTVTDHVISGRALRESANSSFAVSGTVAPSGVVSGHLFQTFLNIPWSVFTGTLNRNGGSGTWVQISCSGTWTASRR